MVIAPSTRLAKYNTSKIISIFNVCSSYSRHIPEASTISQAPNQWIGLRENLNRKPELFSHEIWGFPVKIFPTKPIHWPKGSKIRYPNNWMVNTKLDIHICGPLVLGLPFWPKSILPSRNIMGKSHSISQHLTGLALRVAHHASRRHAPLDPPRIL